MSSHDGAAFTVRSLYSLPEMSARKMNKHSSNIHVSPKYLCRSFMQLLHPKTQTSIYMVLTFAFAKETEENDHLNKTSSAITNSCTPLSICQLFNIKLITFILTNFNLLLFFSEKLIENYRPKFREV